jgi:hypothetical protein
MTKPELRDAFPKLIKVCDTPEYRAVLDCAREECPFLDSKPGDATALISNEGKLQGWNAALRYLKTVFKHAPDREQPSQTLKYNDPDPRPPIENPNKKS